MERQTDEVPVVEGGELQLHMAFLGLREQQCGKIMAKQTNKVDGLRGLKGAGGR